MVEISERLLTQIEATTIEFRRELRKAEKRVGLFERISNKTLGKIDKRFNQFGKSVDKALGTAFSPKNMRRIKQFGVGVTAAGTGFAFATKKAIEFADNIGKTADKVGVTTDQLQELRFAAQQTGVASNQLDIALQRFVRRTAEAAQGSGELIKVLDQYNIEVKDANGNTRDSIDVLKDLADATKNAESESEQLRIAFKAFDSEGAALVNLLRQGSEGLERFEQQARSLGLVMDENLIRKAEQANDELNILAESLRVQLAGSLASISPAIIKIGESIREVIPDIVAFWERWALPDNMQSVEMLNMRMAELLQTARKLREEGQTEEGALFPALSRQAAEALPGIQTAEEAERRIEALRLQREEAIKTREALEAIRATRAKNIPVANEHGEALAESARITDEESDAIARRIVQMNEDIRVTDESSDAITERMMAMKESSRITDEEAEKITERLQGIKTKQEEVSESTVNYSRVARDSLSVANDALQGNLETWEDWGAAVLRILQEVIVAQASSQGGLFGTPGSSGGGLFGTPGSRGGGIIPIRHSGGTARDGLHNLQRGEEIIQSKVANQPGVRSMLKTINAGGGFPAGPTLSIGTIDARGATPGTADAIEMSMRRILNKMARDSFGTTNAQKRRGLAASIQRTVATDVV